MIIGEKISATPATDILQIVLLAKHLQVLQIIGLGSRITLNI